MQGAYALCHVVKRNNDNNGQRSFLSIGLPAKPNNGYVSNIGVSTSPEGNTSSLTNQFNISNVSTPAYSMNSPLEVARMENQTLTDSDPLKVQFATII
jgi:hypothetical protein